MSLDLVIEECPPEWGTEIASPGINPAHIFNSCICGCGREKRSGGPLCGVCWTKAPVDLRRDAWKRDSAHAQVAALAELRRVLGHTHEPVKPRYTPRFPVAEPVIENATPIHTAEAITEAVATEEVPDSEVIELQPAPLLPQLYVVRLTEEQLDRFLIAASAEWKQRMVQSLLDEEVDG